MRLTDRDEQRIFQLRSLPTKVLAERFGVTQRAVRNCLQRMKQRGEE